MESLLTPDRHISIIPTLPEGLNKDTVSDDLLQRYQFELSSNAVISTGDGDCLFNAVSTHLVGDESMSLELRYKACLEMVLNADNIMNHKSRASFMLISPEYTAATKSCAKIGHYSCVWTIIALCNIIQIPIKYIYPCVNRSKDISFVKLNQTFKPERWICETEPLRVMWTNTMEPRKGKTWTPNHFVPIVNNNQLRVDPVVNESVNKTVQKQDVHVVNKSTPMKEPAISILPETPKIHVASIKQTKKRLHPSSSDESHDDELSYNNFNPTSPFFNGSKRKWKRIQSSPASPDVSSDLGDTKSPFSSFNKYSVLEDEEVKPSESSNENMRANILSDLPGNDRFMTIDEIFNVVTNEESKRTVDFIPRGLRNNVYVLIKSMDGRRRDFTDDCGIWGSAGTSVNSHYIIEHGRLKNVPLKNGLYCTEKKVQKKKMYVPLQPQPILDDIILIHRYYAKLKEDENYRKRVTVFTKLPSMYSQTTGIGVVEYLGEFKGKTLKHGNRKSRSPNVDIPYERTRPEVLQEAARITKDKHQMPIKTCQDMAMDNSMEAPRSKQVRDKIYHESKKTDSCHGKMHNVADEVLRIISMCQNGEGHIREMIHVPNKPPSIIVYTDEQMEDIKSNCVGDGASVIGIDRTFNLGACFVTTMTYKNRKIFKRETFDCPIFLGPTLLHWDGETDTYYKFFCHVNAKFGYPKKLLVGSDEEKAIKKAIVSAFPNFTQLLCSKHIKDNIRRFLKDKEGCSTKDRKSIVNLLFNGEKGVVYSDDSFTFSERIKDIDALLTKYPNFERYFNNRIKGLIEEYIMRPMLMGEIDEPWTNNNSESLNNRLKQVLDWKTKKLPELVEKINEVSFVQMTDLRRVLYGSRNYVLQDSMKKYMIPSERWAQMTSAEKSRSLSKFVTAKPQDRRVNDYVLSSDGNLKMPKVANVARKPCQRKRPRSEKTTK